MQIEDLLEKTCLIGLSYFDIQGELIQQIQHSGKVVHVDGENGISIEIIATTEEASLSDTIASDKARVFVLPSALAPWFVAPKGTYRGPDKKLLIEDPDYFVVWDIFRTQDRDAEGVHEWWEWQPQLTPPTVS